MYYTSRTLPNFFAFGLTTLAARNLLPLAGRRPTSRSSRNRQVFALSLLTAAGIIFRSELALLLAAHTLYLHFHPHIQLPLPTILTTGIISATSSLALTIPIDTFFWRSPQPLWPELSGFIYNVYNGQSLNWGTSPWHFYLTSSLPRLLFNPFILLACIPFTLLSPLLRPPALAILTPNLAYILLYSLQPHKEWRFIIYTIPPLTAVAAAGASWIWTRRAKSLYYRGLALMLVASTLAAFLASAGMLAISRQNYPGAEALLRLHGLVIPETDPRPVRRVHMDTLACMTGITRFLEIPPPLSSPPPLAAATGTNVSSLSPSGPLWLYSKTESPSQLLDPTFWRTIDYALTSTPHLVIGSWEVLGTVSAYAGLALSPPTESPHLLPEQTEFEKWMQMLQDADVGKSRMERLGDRVGKVWGWVERVMRRRVTGGWWVKVRREEVLRILKRVEERGEWGVRWEMEMEVGEGERGPIVGVDDEGGG
ncbi:MAG: alpha-1,6- mannosyltransferase [Ramalina farinacea]|uniref:Mannosyltransferase n=1 Tax=Ramalina farinacea TaxID=258253 RepID=A0AA43QMD2_9LECA|nr:alpha-1,6- mannosyltransferase [Ramalina farinacea]